MKSSSPNRTWTFLTNHAMVLIQVWKTPNMTVRVIAEHVRITERAAHRIIAELVSEGYVTRRRVGRNNYYFVTRNRTFRHPEVSQYQIDRLLRIFDVDAA